MKVKSLLIPFTDYANGHYNFGIPLYSDILDVSIKQGSPNMICLLYKMEDETETRSRTIYIKVLSHDYISEDIPSHFKYWGTTQTFKQSISVHSNTYDGSIMLKNDPVGVSNHIFVSDIKTIEELRDENIKKIIY